MKLSALLTSAGVNISVCVVLFILYSLLRKQPTFVNVYFSNRFARVRSSLLGGFHFERFVPSPSWILKAWEASDEEIIAAGGLDAFVLVRMIVFSFRIFSIATILGLFLVVPLNYFGQDILRQKIPAESLEVFTIVNVEPRSRWFWVHCLALYIISCSACLLLYFEYKSISKKRLAYFSSSLSRPNYFTILVRSIPKSKEESYSHTLEKFFMNYYASSYLSHQIVYRSGYVQKLLTDAEEVFRMVKISQKELYSGSSFMRCGTCGGATSSFKMISDEHERDKGGDDCDGSDLKKKESAAALVFFRNRYAALVASQGLQSSNPMSWVTDLAPEPDDMYWSNICVPYRLLWIRKIALLVASILFVAFFLVPVSLTQSLVHLDKLQKTFPFLRGFLKRGGVTQLVTGYLPSVVLILFSYIVPPLMMLFSKMEGSISRSGRKRSACIKVLYFFIWNVFFGNIVSGSVLDRLNKIFKDVNNLLSTAVPSTATFFMTYVLTSGWASLSVELLQPFGLICRLFSRFIMRKKDVSCHETLTFPYHTEVPRILLFGLFGFAYAILAPLILPFLVVYYSIAYLVYRNQILNVYVTKYQTGGTYWPIVHNTTIFSMVLMQIIALAVFGFKKSSSTSSFTIPLIICTLLFNEYCRQRFEPLFKDPPAQILIEMDRQDEAHGRMKEMYQQLTSAYCQFKSTLFVLSKAVSENDEENMSIHKVQVVEANQSIKMRILWCTIVVLSFVNLLLAEEIIAPNKDSSVNDASAKPVGNAEPSEPVISAAPAGPVSGNVASAEPVSNVAPAEPVFGSAPTVPVINSAAAPAVVVTSAVPNAPGFNAAPVGQEYSFSIHLDKADQHHLVNVQYSHPNPNIGNSLNNGEKASIEEGAGEWTNQPLTFVSSAAAVPDSSVPKVPTRPLIAGFQKETVDSFAVPYSSQSGYYQPSSPAIPISAFRIYNSNKYGQPTSQSFRTPSSESNEYPKSIVYQHGSYLVPSSQAGYVQSDRAAHSYPSYTTYSVGGENSGHLYNSEENQQAIEKFTREIPANHKAVDDETISRRSDKNQQINAKFSPAIPLTYEHLKPEEYQSIVNGVNNKQSFRYSPSVEPQNESTRYSSISQTPADTYYLLPAGNPEISKVITNYYKSPQAESWTIRQSPANVQYVPTTRLSSITQSPVKTLNSPSAAYSVYTDNPAYQSIFAKHSAIVQSPVKSYYSSPVGYETVPLKSFNKYYTPSEAYSKEYSAQSNLPTISYYSPSTGDFADKQKSAITYYLSPYSSKTESPSTSYYPSSAWNYESSPAVQPAYSRAGYQGFNVFPNDPYNTAAAAPVAQEYLVAEETQKGYLGQSQNSPASLLLHKSAQLAPSQSSPAVSYLSVGHQGYNVFPHDPYSKINQQVYQQYSLAAPTTQEYLESEESENVYPGQVQSSPASSFVIKNAHYLPAQSSPAIGYSSVGYQGYNVFPNDPYSKINQQAYQQYSPAVPAANEYSVSEESQSVYPGQTQYSPSSLLAHKNAQAASSQSPPAVSYASEGYQGYNVFPNDPYSKVNQQVYQQYSPAASTSYGYLGSKQSSNSYLSQPQYSLQTPQYHKLANSVAQLSPASNSEYVGHYGYNVFPSDPYSKLSQQVYQEYSPAAPVAQDYSDSSDTQNVYQGFYQYAPPSAGYQKIVGSGSLQYSPSVSPVNKYAGHYGFNVLPSEPYPQYSPAAPGTSEYSEYSQSVPAVHQKPAIYSPAAQSFGSNLSQKQTTKLQPIVVAEQSGEYQGPEEAQQIVYSSNHVPPKRAAFYKPSSDEETKEKEIASTVAVHE